MLNELRALGVFAKVVETGTFRGAARALKLSPSAVSHHITTLEGRYGVALLYRSTRRLALTPEGEHLYKMAAAMVTSAENALAALNSHRDIPHGTIRLTAPMALGASPLTESLAKFASLFPSVRLVLHFTDTPKDLIEDGYDLKIRMGWPQQSSMEMLKLFALPRRLVASPDYIAARKRPLRPADLVSWSWIHFEPRPRTVELSHPKHGVERVWGTDQITVDTSTVMHQLAICGAGLATLPSFMVYGAIVAGQLAEVLPQWKLASPGVFAIWPRNAPKSGLTLKLIEHLAQVNLPYALPS
jgi:DNA-binding transcriptional LysR family regulator